MKFKIRFADQIVGFFIVVALVSLVAVIFLLGSQQRWFSHDYYYKTYASSASGLSVNMPVLLKGVTIGNVKQFKLNDNDQVEVIFKIFDTYNNRVKEGSLVQVLVSPIGLGNQFVFHPGLGITQYEGAISAKMVTDKDYIPGLRSTAGKDIIAAGLNVEPSQSDSIAILMDKANVILDNVASITAQLDLALEGSPKSVVGTTLANIRETSAALPDIPVQISRVVSDIDKTVADINEVSARLASPDGVSRLLDGDGELITGLENSIVSISGILNDVKQSTAYFPREMPQIVNLITQVRTSLEAAQDVLIALRNNPLLRNGIPDHMETDTSGTNPRDIRF